MEYKTMAVVGAAGQQVRSFMPMYFVLFFAN
jgi:hypothetical protein